MSVACGSNCLSVPLLIKKLPHYRRSLLLDSLADIGFHLPGAIIVQMFKVSWNMFVFGFCEFCLVARPSLVSTSNQPFLLILSHFHIWCFNWSEIQTLESFSLHLVSLCVWSHQNARYECVDKCQIYTSHLCCFSKSQNHLFTEFTTTTTLLPMM